MKLYKKLQGMKKSAKIGLAGSLAYAGFSFITPVLANNGTKSFDINNITTIEQIDQVYDEQIKICVNDGKITYKEITHLDDILEKKKSLLVYQKNGIEWEIHNLERPYDLDSNISTVINSIEEMDSKEMYTSPEFEKIKEDFDKKILRYFPFLLKQPTFYSAHNAIEENLNPIMKNLTLKADKFLKTYYKDASLELLTGKEKYTIKDVATFYEILHEEREEVCFNSKVKQEKQKLEKKLGDLENEMKQQLGSNKTEIAKLNKKREEVYTEIENLGRERIPFKKYLDAKINIDKFIKKWDDFNNYTGFSIVAMYESTADGRELKGVHLDFNNLSFQSYNESAISSLKNYLKSKGFDVEVEALKNPAKTMFPWPWWVNTLFGVAFPVFRNILTAKFIRREVDEFDVIEGIIEPFFFTLLLDSVFPLMYPLRVFGTPFLVEPLRAATDWRRLK